MIIISSIRDIIPKFAVGRLFAGHRQLFPEQRAVPRLALLDGLRGVAALSVVLYHYSGFYNPFAKHAPTADYRAQIPFYDIFWLIYDNGLYAVQMFWLISGFVFGYVYFGRIVSAGQFACSRLARLYPLHIITLIIVAFLQFVSIKLFDSSLFYENNDVYHFMLQIFFASSWGLEEGFSFNGPIWSVSVEFLIYGIFFFLLPILPRMGVAIPLAAALVSLLLKLALPGNLVLNCGFYFFFGSALAVVHAALVLEGWMWKLVAAGLAAIGVVALAHPSASVNQIIGLPASFGAVILLVSYLEPFAGKRLAAASIWIGDTTYGVYLWHVPLQMALILLLMPTFDLAALASSGWCLVLFTLLVVVVARLSFVYIERPTRRYLIKRRKFIRHPL